ncbi:MIF4G-like type 3 [Trinorchestia longiramus]|nr:MIF4G-like type 3 [Trinorchestia longiramus]
MLQMIRRKQNKASRGIEPRSSCITGRCGHKVFIILLSCLDVVVVSIIQRFKMVAPNTLTPERSRKAQRKLQKKKKKFGNSHFTEHKGKYSSIDLNLSKNEAKILSMQVKDRPTQNGSVMKKKSKQIVSAQNVVQGPNFKQNSAARFAALKEYIKNELGQDKQIEKKSLKDFPASSSKKSGKSGKNTIKDKNKLEELQHGIDQDDKEINFLQRQLQHNSRQKKSNNMFRNIFGSEIGDLFDTLETEPTEADLLAQKPLEAPKLPNKVRKEPKLELPKNTIFVETSKIGCGDPPPEKNLTSTSKASKKRLLNEIDEDSDSKELQKNKKLKSTLQCKTNLKNKVSPIACGREIFTPVKKECKTQTDGISSKGLKSIVNTKSKKLQKRTKGRNVTFDFSKNKVRYIPAIVKESGFKVVDDNAPLFWDMETDFDDNCVQSDDDSDDVSVSSQDSEVHDESLALDQNCNLQNEICFINNKKNDEKMNFLNKILKQKQNCDFTARSSLEKKKKGILNEKKSSEFCSKKKVSEYEMSAGESSSKCSTHINIDSLVESISESCSEDGNSIENDSSDISDSDEEDTGSDGSDSDKPAQIENLSEDIYGRIRDSRGNIVEATPAESSSGYLTPAKRKLDEALQEQLNDDTIKRVRTQLRGRLNRLAEANLAGAVTMTLSLRCGLGKSHPDLCDNTEVCTQVCSLYETHPRHLLNVVLSELLLTELAGETLTLDRHCQECAVLLTALASNVAEEIGAHVLTDFVISWHEELQKSADASNARLRNCLMFVCHLFSFGLLHSALLYDLLTRLTAHFTANAVDQMMVVVSSVGFLLRKEDPLALKDFIIAVQSQGASSDLPQLQLLNTMLRAVKNNNESKMPDYDPTYTEHLRKLLKSYVGGEVKVTPLRVTLDDLLHSETRGRWWIVGSAYSGPGARPSQSHAPSKALSTETKFSADFMKMAESMRISRPPKINILFTLTVGSESVSEAIIKLKDLSLAPTQEKLIFDVMLFCIQKMRIYKPFYAILSIRLCVSEGKYKRLLQHALWDKFTDLDALKSKELKHLAKFLVHTIKEDALNLSVLKTLPFVDTNRKIVDFLEDIFCQLFTDEGGDQVSMNAFKKLFLSKKLEPLRRQFSLFLQLFMLPKCEAGELDVRCRARVQRVVDLLGSDGGVLF